MNQIAQHTIPNRPAGEELGVLSLLARIPQYARLLLGMLTDGRVSTIDRLLVVAAIGYVISPLDFIPDVIPFLGQVDDLVLVVAAVSRLFDRSSREVMLSHWSGLDEELDPSVLRKLIAFASLFALPGRRRRPRRSVEVARGA